VAGSGDVNGDGYADVMVAAPGVMQAFLYVGGASGIASSPQILTAPAGDTGDFGLLVASAGDVNGDGYADVVVDQIGEVFLFLGGAAGLASSPAITFPDPGPGRGAFGIRASCAGDVNGDGYADVVIGDNMSGKAYLYLGSAAGPPSTPDLTLTAPSTAPGGSGFGHSIVGAGDVNGDGYADLVVGALGASVNATDDFAGKAYVYLGSAAGLATSPTVTLLGSEVRGAFGRWVSNAGDVNGDGYADVVIGADGENGADGAGSPGRAYVYLGSAVGLAASPAVTLIGPDGPGSWFGRCVAAAGDVNGDGYADIVIGADAGGRQPGGAAGTTVGWAYVYLGNRDRRRVVPRRHLDRPQRGERLRSHRRERAAASGPTRRAVVVEAPSRARDPGRQALVPNLSRPVHRNAKLGWARRTTRRAAGRRRSVQHLLRGQKIGELFRRFQDQIERVGWEVGVRRGPQSPAPVDRCRLLLVIGITHSDRDFVWRRRPTPPHVRHLDVRLAPLDVLQRHACVQLFHQHRN
jgi:hypothetical protein